MTEVIEVIDSKAERARLVHRTDVLDKVKALAMLPGHGVATTAQVADFYEVGRKTVVDMARCHRDELESNGYRVVEGAELLALKREVDVQPLLRQMRSAALWDRRAVLLLGMLLRGSEVATEVRRYLRNVEEKTHEAVVTQRTTGLRFDGLTAQITQSIEDHFGPRLAELEDRIARLESAVRDLVMAHQGSLVTAGTGLSPGMRCGR